MPDTLWYYAVSDEQFGPVTFDALKRLVESGELSPDDLLWREGLDAWTPAVNLRALFEAETGPARPATPLPPSTPASAFGHPPLAPSNAPRPRVVIRSALPGQPSSLPRTLRTLQLGLWGICALIVLAGTILFARALLIAKELTEEAAAAAVYATFFLAAYVMARAGEKLARLLVERK